jgi:glycosyltransferase involved in cell wall biosynthesis
MKRSLQITFVLPGFHAEPIGGYRVVYEYADFLASRGHRVTIVYLRQQPPDGGSLLSIQFIKKRLWALNNYLRHRPLVPWHRLNSAIRLSLRPDLRDATLPNADAIIATGWETAAPVAALSVTKGVKFYLIQHYETWAGPKDEVDATWRLPLLKIAISKWLVSIGERLGASNIQHIPNGIDFEKFRITTAPGMRPMSIVSLFHYAKFKGVPDALAVLRLYHEAYPDVPVTMFGALARGQEIPEWITYYENPDQDFLVKEIYNKHAVYLGASIEEGWGLPPAEAMACGCVFVGTDIGGFREHSTNNDTALLSAPGDHRHMLANLIAVTEDAKLRQRIQENGTSNIRQFTWERAGASLEEYIQKNIGDTSGA